MKTLLTTAATALVLATSAYAETHSATIDSFEMGHGDFYASDLIGMRIYATEQDLADGDTVAAGAATEWSDIGEINDLIVGDDGMVEAVLVDIGGFLGIGEKTVAFDMDALKVRMEEGTSDRFLVVNASSQMLDEAAGFEAIRAEMADVMAETEAAADATGEAIAQETAEAAAEVEQTAEETAATTEAAAEEAATDANAAVTELAEAAERPMLTAPTIERDGYAMVEQDQLTAEELTGMRIYGSDDADVGEIKDILMSDSGQVDKLILDIGGWLGLGEHQIAVTPKELTFLRSDDGSMTVHINATQEELEAQPEFEG